MRGRDARSEGGKEVRRQLNSSSRSGMPLTGVSGSYAMPVIDKRARVRGKDAKKSLGAVWIEVVILRSVSDLN